MKIFKWILAACVPVLLLAVIFCGAMPEIAGETQTAARNGDATAQYELARLYFGGQELPRDITMAVHWVQKAAAQNEPHAMQALGFLYITGNGVPKNAAKAFKLLHAAADKNMVQAQRFLAQSYGRGEGVPQSNEQFLYWVNKAADNNDGPSQFNLAILYLSGDLVEKDLAKGRALLTKAADQGVIEAQVALGEFLAQGIDGKPDLVGACTWFAIAGTAGHPGANAYLMQVTRRMTKEQMDQAANQARQWLERVNR